MLVVVLLDLLNCSRIAYRSYTVPLGVTTGSNMGSNVKGHIKHQFFPNLLLSLLYKILLVLLLRVWWSLSVWMASIWDSFRDSIEI